jgi:hypothetical protein
VTSLSTALSLLARSAAMRGDCVGTGLDRNRLRLPRFDRFLRRRRHGTIALLLTLAVACVLAGCGASPGSPIATPRQFMAALIAHNYQRACKYLSNDRVTTQDMRTVALANLSTYVRTRDPNKRRREIQAAYDRARGCAGALGLIASEASSQLSQIQRSLFASSARVQVIGSTALVSVPGNSDAWALTERGSSWAIMGFNQLGDAAAGSS